MRIGPLTRRQTLWLAAGIAVICAIEIWWHRTPLLVRVNPDMYYLLMVGQAGEMRDKGDLKDAEETLKRAIARFPTWYNAYLSLGDTLLKAGDTNGALSNYRLALEYCGRTPTNYAPIEAQARERGMIENRIQHLK